MPRRPTPKRGAAGLPPPPPSSPPATAPAPHFGGPHGEHGYWRPPFEPAHELSTRHGAYSARRVNPVAEELARAALDRQPSLAKYPEALAQWARVEAQALLLGAWYADGILDADGIERPGVRFAVQYERLAADLRARLGLDPRAEAELARDRADATRTAVDLEAVRARGRAAMRDESVAQEAAR